MTITLDVTLAAMVAVPCIIAIAQATDSSARIIASIMLALAGVYGVAPHVLSDYIRGDVGKYLATAVGVWSIIACVRIQQPIISTLIVTGGVLSSLLAWGVIARA